MATSSSSVNEAATLPIEERTTPRRSQRNRSGVANLALSQSSSEVDEEVVPSTLGDVSPHDDDDEVPSSLPPARPTRNRVNLDSDRYEDDRNQGDSDDDDEAYATAEAFSSDEDDIPISSIRGKNKTRQKATSKHNQKKSNQSVRNNPSCSF